MTARKLTDKEFTRLVFEIGYVEACVESARRDGGVFDEDAIRAQAIDAERNLNRYQAARS